MKRVLSLLFLLWTGGILVAYYVVQKPSLLYAFPGLLDTVWTLLVAAILLFNSYGIGKCILQVFNVETQDVIDHLLLSIGIGLGALGLLGLLFSVLQLARTAILTTFQLSLTLFFYFRNDLRKLRIDIQFLRAGLALSWSQYNLFTKITLVSILILSFLLSLVPPFEATDALLYHLALPANILQNGGLRAVENTPFWFPSLSENTYLWALGLGSERVPQLIHWLWMLLSTLLLWHWASKTWNAQVACKTLLLLAAIPSLSMLASWAYADMALVYYVTTALYAFAQYRITKLSFWRNIAAIMTGFAMGIKYTSFVLPLTCGVLLLFERPFRRAIRPITQFSLLAIAVACPWYLRNAFFMNNPLYPFIFGGRYWDNFLANWYAEAGTGIGWDALSLVMLPLNTTLGVHDVTFYDGRIGALFLLFAPFTTWILWTKIRNDSNRAEREPLIVIGLFSLLSFAAWTFGVISSAGLWQARLLFPTLIPFAIPTALAWDALKQWDTSNLRISFLVDALIGIVLILTITDNGIFVIQRNPLAVALGAQSREQYIARINPAYAALMTLIDELPPDATIYNLFEPRSYGLSRSIQADPLLYNFSHDVYLFQTPDEIIERWRVKHYTHILVYERGFELMKASNKLTPAVQNALQETLAKLTRIAQTPDKIYTIYQIP